ncbi:tyrosine protein kinase [Bacillus manliponensis]|uniref:non-specific protein-tyrosine kinase n=1 Tax=Bacillus manliponensis TaxID=574376 RepID=A0A073JYX3_9BACI|nr:CpsD/CapB family tyrosine-protein kinase [Bacillus manliponensis]KEK20274.1 tyrosine protein kinase [Bacillus manliponensis]
MVFKRRKRFKEKSLITHTAPNCKIAEQYRTIRTNLQFSSIIRKDQTLVITSPNGGEGKSTVTANLAVSIAGQEEKVLVIDASLRSPSIHSMFHLENDIGLTTILIGRSTLEKAVKKTEVENLYVLTSGPIPFNPAELLSSEAMEILIKQAVEQYDIILFDSPSVLEVSDTSILSDQCDGVLLVVSCHHTANESALEAKRILGFTKGRLVGAILNEKT